MEGVGAVFRAYRDGELTADDEVAVAHGDEPGVFRPFSEALVNIRATLDAAVLSGVLEPPARDQLVEIAQSLFYPSRAWPTIIDRARCDGLEEEALHDFESWLPGNAVDLKREDAPRSARSNAGADRRPVHAKTDLVSPRRHLALVRPQHDSCSAPSLRSTLARPTCRRLHWATSRGSSSRGLGRSVLSTDTSSIVRPSGTRRSSGPSSLVFTSSALRAWGHFEQPSWSRSIDPQAPLETPADIEPVLEELRLDPELYELTKARALNRWLALRVADAYGFSPTQSMVQEEVDTHRARHGLLDEPSMSGWMADAELDEHSAEAIMVREARTTWALSIADYWIERLLADVLRLDGEYARLAERAQCKRRILGEQGLQRPMAAVLGTDEEDVLEWYLRRHRDGAASDLAKLAEELDFEDEMALIDAVLREYAFVQTQNGGATDTVPDPHEQRPAADRIVG